MSGGKYTTETSTFVPGVTEAVLTALVTSGASAVAAAAQAKEMKDLIIQNKEKYDKVLKEQQNETEKLLQEYSKALNNSSLNNDVSTDINQSQDALINNTTDVVVIKTKGFKRVDKIYDIPFEKKEKKMELFKTITSICDKSIALDTSYSAEIDKIKKNAVALLKKNTDTENEWNDLTNKLNEILPKLKEEDEKTCKMKEEYYREYSRAKGLCKLTNTKVLLPVFSLERADSNILRLKQISEQQMKLLEEIEKNPVINMPLDERKKAKELVASKICATLIEQGIELKSVSEINSSNICYYSYYGQLLKVSVTDTGMVSFEVIGDLDKKTGFNDNKKVVETMEKFQKDFPELVVKLSKNNVTLQLNASIEPSDEIVDYEKIDVMNEEERRINDAAVMAMLHNANNVRYVGE